MVCQWHRNREISLSSRNNPEMSQHSSDVPIVVNFSVYIFPWDLLWAGWLSFKLFWGENLWHFIDLSHWNQKLCSQKSQMSESFDVPSGCPFFANDTSRRNNSEILSLRKQIVTCIPSLDLSYILCLFLFQVYYWKVFLWILKIKSNE